MNIVLFRHGHKVFSIDQDPGLSPKGFEQSHHLLEIIENKIIPPPTHVWVSEKKRTYQTLEKSIDVYKPVLYKKSDLNHRDSEELLSSFHQRIQKYIYDLTSRIKSNETHYVCTHYDWIEVFSNLAHCQQDLNSYEYSNWTPGQFLVFEYSHSLLNVIQKGAL